MFHQFLIGLIGRAFELIDKPKSEIISVTMPGFGTTDRTYQNALTMMKSIGTTLREINIAPAVRQHFSDIGHDENIHDTTYENSQARERTQILMDIANREGGIIVGTEDLSETALSWCTFNGILERAPRSRISPRSSRRSRSSPAGGRRAFRAVRGPCRERPPPGRARQAPPSAAP